MSVAVGDRAPDFTLKNADLEEVSLSSMRGKNVVILFFPLAFTSVCTEELCGVSAGIDDYKGLDATVIGISVDSPFSLQAWAEKEKITIPLLSDFNKEVSEAYGSQYEDLLGFRGVAKRSAFVLDKDGVVRFASVSDDAKVVPDFEAIKGCLKSLT
jgi:peroxiredoxin